MIRTPSPSWRPEKHINFRPAQKPEAFSVWHCTQLSPKRWFRGAGEYSIRVKTNKSSWKTKFALTGKELKLHILSGWDRKKSVLVEVQRHWRLSPLIQIKFKHIDKYGSVHVQITNNSKTTLYGTPSYRSDEGFVERKTATGWVPAHGIYSSDGFFKVDAGKSVIVAVLSTWAASCTAASSRCRGEWPGRVGGLRNHSIGFLNATEWRK